MRACLCRKRSQKGTVSGGRGEFFESWAKRVVGGIRKVDPMNDRSLSRGVPNFVKQTKPTNCMAACVASLLKVPIESVPGVDGVAWDWDAFQAWLAARGLQAIEMYFGNGGTLYPVAVNVPCILSGESPRGNGKKHAVCAVFTGLNFELTHDPHESNQWIDGEPTHATFFVRTEIGGQFP